MKLKNRPRLTATLLAVAAAFVALAFTWFQGFEIDTSNWFADGQAVVNRVLGTTVTPSTSTMVAPQVCTQTISPLPRAIFLAGLRPR